MPSRSRRSERREMVSEDVGTGCWGRHIPILRVLCIYLPEHSMLLQFRHLACSGRNTQSGLPSLLLLPTEPTQPPPPPPSFPSLPFPSLPFPFLGRSRTLRLVAYAIAGVPFCCRKLLDVRAAKLLEAINVLVLVSCWGVGNSND